MSVLEANPLFAGIQYKLSNASQCPFDGELFVRVAKEITATGDGAQCSTDTALNMPRERSHDTPPPAKLNVALHPRLCSMLTCAL